MLGPFGAALLYVTASSLQRSPCCSAVEGLEVATSAFSSVIVPLTCLVLIALFWAQRGGTNRIAAVFAPVTLVWFIAIAAAGLPWIARAPAILGAVNPLHAVRFFVANRGHGFLVLGSVVLCVTGGEALYADMGHFGTPAIRRAWIACVFPALLLNYFGQGALLLVKPAAAENPFYALFPAPLLIPMVILATAATVVASQALISGVFSLTRQAVQLGYLPRVTVVHTSARTEGQIYIPEVNWLLMIACVVLVVAFKESGRLAAAYGIAVTGTMGITSILFAVHARREWGWSHLKADLLLAFLLAFDLLLRGLLGQDPQRRLVPAARRLGRVHRHDDLEGGARPPRREARRRVAAARGKFLEDLAIYNPHRVSGLGGLLDVRAPRCGTPSVLLRHFKHNKSLHKQVVLLSIATDAAAPEVEPDDIVRLKDFGMGFLGRDGPLRLHAEPGRHGGDARLQEEGPRAGAREHQLLRGPGDAPDAHDEVQGLRAVAAPRSPASSRATRAPRPSSSRSRRTGSWRSARRSSSDALGGHEADGPAFQRSVAERDPLVRVELELAGALEAAAAHEAQAEGPGLAGVHDQRLDRAPARGPQREPVGRLQTELVAVGFG